MSRLRVVAAGIAVAAVALLATAAPASAHDELLSSTPSDGERLPTAPTEVSLTFSSAVLDVGAAVVVADADGRDWAAAEPELEGGVVTVPLDDGMPVAGYEVRWRVVSSDGHPISGVIPFTVGDAQPLERTAATDAATPDAAEEPASGETTGDEGSGALRIVLIGAAGAALAVAVFAIILLLRRRANAGGPDDPRDAASDDSRKARP